MRMYEAIPSATLADSIDPTYLNHSVLGTIVSVSSGFDVKIHIQTQ